MDKTFQKFFYRTLLTISSLGLILYGVSLVFTIIRSFTQGIDASVEIFIVYLPTVFVFGVVAIVCGFMCRLSLRKLRQYKELNMVQSTFVQPTLPVLSEEPSRTSFLPEISKPYMQHMQKNMQQNASNFTPTPTPASTPAVAVSPVSLVPSAPQTLRAQFVPPVSTTSPVPFVVPTSIVSSPSLVQPTSLTPPTDVKQMRVSPLMQFVPVAPLASVVPVIGAVPKDQQTQQEQPPVQTESAPQIPQILQDANLHESQRVTSGEMELQPPTLVLPKNEILAQQIER